MSLAHIANIAGLIGVVIVLWSYLLLQAHKVTAHSLFYSISNLIGSCLILFSLYFAWNLPAAIVEFAWVAISIFGLYKGFTLRKKYS